MDTTAAGIAAFDTPLGVCAVRWTSAGIASVRLPSPRTATLSRVEAVAVPPPSVLAVISAIQATLAGVPADLRGVRLDDAAIEPFRREVYAATREVQAGRTATYGEIARAIGRPDAAREVGAALARNPFPLVVPCHRVVGANGKLMGF